MITQPRERLLRTSFRTATDRGGSRQKSSELVSKARRPAGADTSAYPDETVAMRAEFIVIDDVLDECLFAKDAVSWVKLLVGFAQWQTHAPRARPN